jgi:hypothetical protein
MERKAVEYILADGQDAKMKNLVDYRGEKLM